MLVLLVMLLGVLAGLGGTDSTPPESIAPDRPSLEAPRNPWIEPTREVLAQACGSCHRPGLSTSNPHALAVFNLQDPVWYGTMTDDQLRSLGRRIQAASKLEQSDRDIVNMFVNCKLTGACSDVHPQESP